MTTFLDVDVPPSVSRGSAGLGTDEQLLECVKASTVLKPSMGKYDFF